MTTDVKCDEKSEIVLKLGEKVTQIGRHDRGSQSIGNHV
jgi:hypothetical protein